MTTVWKINIKTAADKGKDPKAFCLEKGIMGIGWPVYSSRETLTKKQFLKAARTRYTKNGKKFPGAINAMVSHVKVNDLVWLRDNRNVFHLGRVLSDWKRMSRDGTGDVWDQHDIHNTRDMEWHQIGTIDNVPWGIVKQFSRGTLTKMGKDAGEMLRFSQIKYNGLSTENKRVGAPTYEVKDTKNSDLFSHVGPDDCEDIVALYLKHKLGYHLLPSTCKPTTKHYEFVFVHRDGHRAVAQVKSGQEDLYGDNYQELEDVKIEGNETRVFLFTTKGACETNDHSNVVCLDSSVLSKFIIENRNLQSRKMRTWIDSNPKWKDS